MKQIPLTQDKFALVDDEDFETLNKHRWCYAHGRAARGVHLGHKKTRTIFMHRELIETGPRLQVMHLDGNKLNNQRANLAAVEGGALRRQTSTKNKTGYRGVHKLHRRYIAKISHQGVIEYLGTYSTALDAARAYDRKLLEYVGPRAHFNVRDIESLAYLPAGVIDEPYSNSQRIPENIQPPNPSDGPTGDGQDNLRSERIIEGWRHACGRGT